MTRLRANAELLAEPVAAGVKLPIQFGAAPAALFGWYHPAPEGARRGAGVVICPPVGDDFVRAHRPLRHLAERLAAAGFPTLRFDYQGTGDSAGDEGDPERARGWVADVGTAVEELRARAGVDRVCLVGLRFGATLAAVAAAYRDDVDGLVLWSGYESGAAFVEAITRLHQLHRRLEPAAFAGDEPEGGQEALGFFLSDDAVDALADVDLRALPHRPAARALVISAGADPTAAHLAASITALGTEVDVRELPPDKFLIAPPHQAALPEESLATVVDWLDGMYPFGSAARVVPARAAIVSPIGADEPRLFGRGRTLFGVLTRPPVPRPQLPAIVMLNAGCVHRIGPHRQYVRLARRWARLGFPVLRFDVSGVGDSAAAPASDENLTYPETALEDVDEALAFLREELGTARFVLTGLCSGADIAFAAGARDCRIAGVVLMNPRTFCVYDLQVVDSFKGARWYQEAMLRKESWMKLLRGEVNVLGVARAVAPKAIGLLRHHVRHLVDGGDGRDSDAPIVTDRLRAMAERGVDTLLVVSTHDPGVDYIDANFADSMRALREVPGFRREDVAGTDHTFTSFASQQRVGDLVTAHLAARYLAGVGP